VYRVSGVLFPVEYKYQQSDEAEANDENDRPVGLPSGVYGRCVHRKHYMSHSSFDNVENVSICISKY